MEDEVNVFINSCGSIQETTIVRLLHCVLEIPPRHRSRALFSAGIKVALVSNVSSFAILSCRN